MGMGKKIDNSKNYGYIPEDPFEDVIFGKINKSCLS